MGINESGNIEIDGDDLVTILDVIEIMGKKGSLTGLTLDDMKKIGEAIIVLEDLKKTVELNIERQKQKGIQAQIPPQTPEYKPPAHSGPAVQAPAQGPRPTPPKQEKQAPLTPKELKEPLKEQAQATVPVKESPPVQTAVPVKEPEKKPQEPEIPANAELRCEGCRVMISPQQAKLSRLLTNKDLCKKCMEAGSKGAT